MRRLREHGPLNVEARPKSYPVLSRGLKTIPACHCTIFTEGRSTWARPLCRREGPRSGHSSIPISHFEVDHILLNNGGGRRRLPSQSGKWCLTLIMSTKEKKGTKWERGEREEERLALLTRKERRGCSQTSQDYKVQRMVGLPTCCSRGLVGSVRVLPTIVINVTVTWHSLHFFCPSRNEQTESKCQKKRIVLLPQRPHRQGNQISNYILRLWLGIL